MVHKQPVQKKKHRELGNSTQSALSSTANWVSSHPWGNTVLRLILENVLMHAQFLLVFCCLFPFSWSAWYSQEWFHFQYYVTRKKSLLAPTLSLNPMRRYLLQLLPRFCPHEKRSLSSQQQHVFPLSHLPIPDLALQALVFCGPRKTCEHPPIKRFMLYIFWNFLFLLKWFQRGKTR